MDERRLVEWISDDDLAARRRFVFGPTPHERANAVTAREQRFRDPPGDVTGAAGDEDRFGLASYGWVG